MDIDIKEVAEEQEEIQKKIDFKMVTFSLSGKDYGIDIMRVKEISKVGKFTYIPNTYPYVVGVHNLRGEIISVIDLRKMFHLQFYQSGKDSKNKGLENVLILKLKTMIIGVIVDSINKVIGISSETIQPPPRLFSDIDIKYISGVVDYADKLYIILDVDMIFEDDKKEELSKKEQMQIIGKVDQKKKKDEKSLEFDFISQTLKAFKKYFVTPLNEEWVISRIDEWASMCKKQSRDIQLGDTDDADSFLYPFYSPCTGLIWDENYNQAVTSLLPDSRKGTIGIWNPGCGKGLETYSIACCMKMKYPDTHLKIWANDNSLIDVSTAPNMLLTEHDIPDYINKENFLVKTEQGYKFSKEIIDAIYFEYHDIMSDNSIPKMDFIIIRDVLSFFSLEHQQKLLKEFAKLLKDDGILFIGMNERIKDKEWKSIGNKTVPAYIKVTE